jgi:hypothetical protein
VSFAGGGEVIGEAFVEIKPLTDKFLSDVEGQTTSAFSKAGDSAGKAFTDKVDSNLKRSEKDGADAGGKVGKAFAKKLTDSADGLQDFGKKATVAISLPIVAGLGLATKAASDLGEATNATGLIFGEARKEIDDFAKHAATSVGTSQRSFRDLTTNVGGLLTALGLTRTEAAAASIDLVKIGADLGSAYNAEPAEAVEALGAAIRGETEPARRFNIVLDAASVTAKAVALGLIEQGAELTNTAKAQATLALITEQASNVQGDFVNTSDGAANKQRILRAELEDTAAKIGANLLPAFTGILNVAEKGVSALSNMGPGATQAGLAIAGIAVAAGPVAGAVGNVISLSETLGPKLKAMSLTGVGAFGVLALGAATFAKAIIDSRQHVQDLYDDLNKGTPDVSSLKSLRTEAEATRKEFEKQSAEFRHQEHDLGPLGAATQQFIENVTPLKNRMQENSDAVGEGRKRLDEFEEAQGRATEAVNVAAARLKLTTGEVETLAEKNKIDLTGSFDDVQEAIRKASDGTSIYASKTDASATATEAFADKTASAEDKLKTFRTALDLALGGHLSITEASIRHQEAIANLTQAITDNGTSTNLLTEKGRNLQGALNDVIASAEGEVDALVKSGEVTEGTSEQKRALVQRLTDLQEKFPQLKGPIQEYIDKIKDIPAEYVTDVHAVVEPAILDLKRFRKAIAELPTGIFVQPGFDPNALIAQFSNQREYGGRVYAGRQYVVGEKRAELFTPDVSGTISPRVPAGFGETGGMNVSVPIVIQGNASPETADLLRQVARDEIGPALERVLDGVLAGKGTTR